MNQPLTTDTIQVKKSAFVLMVYPEIPATYWSYKYALPFVGKKSLMPPLGLMTVAALLPDKYDVKFVDMNASPLTKEDINLADIVFISAMIIQKDSMKKAVELCNRYGIPVTADVETCGDRARRKMEKRYRQLNDNMQNYLNTSFCGFEKFCQSATARLKNDVYKYPDIHSGGHI